MLLCCQGLFILFGLIGMILSPKQVWGRPMRSRRSFLMAFAIFVTPMIAISLSGLVLGGVEPGAIDGASYEEGRARFLAFATELIVMTAGVITSLALWATAQLPPSEEDATIID